MKKIVLIYGLIAGFLSCLGYLISINNDSVNFENGMIYGFASMFLAFSLIFVATNQYRKQNGGFISFGKAFLIGLYISLIASSIYVLVWLIVLYNFHPDFMQEYTTHTLEQLKNSGASAAEITSKTAEMQEAVENYKNPLFVILYTYAEILPLSIIISLISSGIFALVSLNNKKKASTV